MDFTRAHNDYLDPDRHIIPVKLPQRFTVQRTDHHWDKCWGVFDSKESRWVMKDTVKRHCTKRARELNAWENCQ